MEQDNYIATEPGYWYHVPDVMNGSADANITLPDYCRFVQDELKGLLGR